MEIYAVEIVTVIGAEIIFTILASWKGIVKHYDKIYCENRKRKKLATTA
jgi:hypothetical protein